MRRPVLHIYFWLAYLLYDTLLHFTWMGPLLTNVSGGLQAGMAVKTAFTLLPIKLLLVYYIVQRGSQKILSDTTERSYAFLEFGLVFFLSVLLFRVVDYYLVEQGIYGFYNLRPLLNARSIFISILEMGLIGGVALALKLYRLQAYAREREKNLTKQKL